MKLLEICRTDEISEGTPFQAIVEGRDPLAAFKVNGGIYVVDDKCTHAGASLSLEGQQDGYQVICGWHEARFDVRTGQCLGGPCKGGLSCYPVRVIDDRVVVEI